MALWCSDALLAAAGPPWRGGRRWNPWECCALRAHFVVLVTMMAVSMVSIMGSSDLRRMYPPAMMKFGPAALRRRPQLSWPGMIVGVVGGARRGMPCCPGHAVDRPRIFTDVA
eukprot:6387992-Pyramimonas_sp.AAC.1